ncbi:MAG: PDZ domain-containing protein [Acidobacteriia bacterium]|nr:PDZ domain-containing protein [Terriglobia bacterium]
MPGKLPRIALHFAFVMPLMAQDAVRYELRFPNAAHHEAEVRATFSGVRGGVLEVVMSRSSPGRYALHEFAKNVYNFRATDASGKQLHVDRPNPYQWNVAASGSTVIVGYTLFGDRADGTYDAIDPTHAHLNPPATFAWARSFEKSPVSLKIEIAPASDWTVATQLAPGAGGVWTAPNLDALMDAPLEIGPHVMREWSADGSRFRLALHSQAADDVVTRFQRMCEAVVLEEEGVFGAFPKYDNGSYTFLVDYLPYVSGDGMEHRNSTVITSARSLKRESAPQLIGSVAHEFFHSWNVKRIRPRSLEPFDYERVNMSGELWFAEGFTDYYGPLALARAGLTSRDEFIATMRDAVNAVLTAPGREVFSAADMSRRAAFVDGAASTDPENQANTYISYYTYGRAIALGIDLAIRARFPGKSLDDWMRAMWRRHPDIQKPYTMADLELALADATGSREFAREVFRRHIEGLEPMEYASLLARAGFALQPESPAKAWIGTPPMNFSDRGIDITGPTIRDSPLYAAGIDSGDRIIEIDGKSLKTRRDWDDLAAAHKPGDRSTVTVEARSGQKKAEITWAQAPDVWITSFEKVGRQVTPEITRFRDAWLGSKALWPLPKIE